MQRITIRFFHLKFVPPMDFKQTFSLIWHRFGSETSIAISLMTEDEREKCREIVTRSDGSSYSHLTSTFWVLDDNEHRLYEIEALIERFTRPG